MEIIIVFLTRRHDRSDPSVIDKLLWREREKDQEQHVSKYGSNFSQRSIQPRKGRYMNMNNEYDLS